MTIRGQKEIDLCVRKKYFLDYETNKAGNFYLAGYHSNGNFQQVILDERLKGVARNQNLESMSAEEFTVGFLKEIKETKGVLIAYSLAEKNMIQTLGVAAKYPEIQDIPYLNMRKAAKSWARKTKRKALEQLPKLRKKKNDLRNPSQFSLHAIMRLTEFKMPSDYAAGKTTRRFNDVIAGLKIRNQEFDTLTAVQKSKATKAIKHNKYDVLGMMHLFQEIDAEDRGCLLNSIVPLA